MLDLDEFLKRVNVRTARAAQIARCDVSTLSRIRRRVQPPSAVVLLRLQRWADAYAKTHRLRLTDRLSFDYLLDEDERAA